MNEIQNTPHYLKNKQIFDSLEFYFRKLIDSGGKGNNNQTIAGLSRNIFNLLGLKTEIRVEPNKGLEFYGMQVFPRRDVISDIALRIANNEKYSVKELMDILNVTEWIIEIDSKLYNKSMEITPREMVAALLHELGHVVYSNTIPNRIYKSYVIKKAAMNQRFKNVARYNDSIFKKMFEIPITHIFTVKTYTTDVLASELPADKFVVMYGYGKPLNDLIVKIIKNYGGSDINKTEDEAINECGVMWQWMINNFNTMHIRQKALIMAIQAEALKTPLYYVRDILRSLIPQEVFNIHGGGEKDTSYQLVMAEETVNRIAARYTTEGLTSIFGKNKKVRPINQADIDHIAIELERMETSDDKMFILDLIYDQLDIIDASEDLIEHGQENLVSMSQQKIKDFKMQLMELRKMVLNTKVDKKQYGLYAKYPAGYEG